MCYVIRVLKWPEPKTYIIYIFFFKKDKYCKNKIKKRMHRWPKKKYRGRPLKLRFQDSSRTVKTLVKQNVLPFI